MKVRKKFKEVILIKFGGSIITDKNKTKTANFQKIKQLCSELKIAREKTNNLIILAHGAGSFGHPEAQKFGTLNGLKNQESLIGMSKVKLAVSELNTIIISNLIKENVPAITLSPISFLTTDTKKLKKMTIKPLLNLLMWNLVPVIHGDVLSDESLGSTIYSGEQILNLIALKIRKFKLLPKIIIEVGKTRGVYDSNGKTIKFINKENFYKILDEIHDLKVSDVTGGMQHKVKEAYSLAKKGVPTILISSDKGNLTQAILNKKYIGTLIKY